MNSCALPPVPQDEVQAEMWSRGPAGRNGLKLAYDFSPAALKDDGEFPMKARLLYFSVPNRYNRSVKLACQTEFWALLRHSRPATSRSQV